jgi:hypothetical protein
MAHVGRRTASTLALVAVVVVVVAGWFWARPWWQARELTQALEDVPGVASARSADDKTSGSSRAYLVAFDEDISAEELRRGTEAVGVAVEEHEIDGDRASVVMRVNDFTLRPAERAPIPDEVLQAIVALRDADGLVGAEARNDSVIVRVEAQRDVVPGTIRALEALEGADLTGIARTSLRIETAEPGPKVWVDLDDVRGALPIMRQIEEAVESAPVTLDSNPSASASIQVLGNGVDSPTCTVELSVTRDADLPAAARTLSRQGLDCITLSTEPQTEPSFTLALWGPPSGVDRALDLREQVRELGGDVTWTDTGLGAVRLSVDSARAVGELVELIADPARWRVPARTPLTIVWGSWGVVDEQPAAVLREEAPLLTALSAAGFRAAVAGGEGGGQVITLDDGAEGAPDLTTPEGQEVLVRTLRSSGFSGTRQFEVRVDDERYALRFTSTATGEATDVQQPEESGGVWGLDLVEAWNASAR